MFSMFFGSGNLVFPLSIGADSYNFFAFAALGLFVTGIFVPFLGLISMVSAEGDRKGFFREIGRIPAFWLTFLMLAIMGPLGVSARCIIVAFAGIKLVFPVLPEVIFSFVFCLVTGALCWKKAYIVSVIGRYLTPILLICIFLIIGFGIIGAEPLLISEKSPETLFYQGLNQGYQTMDLLAAFFFSASTIHFLRNQTILEKSSQSPLFLALIASFFGMTLLALVYGGFVYLGSAYAPHLAGVPPEQMLTMIAGLTLGPYALPVMSITIALACLTTLIILTTLFADFLSEEVSDGVLSRKVSLFVTLFISFLVSLAGFSKLSGWIATILLFAYPALIALATGKIIERLFKIKHLRIAPICFYSTMIIYGLYKIILMIL